MNIEQYRALKAQEEASQNEETQPTQTTEEIKPIPGVNEVEEVSTSEESKTIEVKGIGEVSIEELKNGYLRQQDYTKKTQEVSRKSKEVEEAVQLYNYLKENPNAAKNIFPGGQLPPPLNPQVVKMRELEDKIYDLMLEREIETLQNKYDDFEIQEVLEMANEKKITSLEDAYHLVKSTKPIDVKSLKEELRQELLKEMIDEKKGTSSIISSRDSKPVVQDNTPQLTDEEKRVAAGLKMSEEEYIKWRDVE